MMLPRRLDSASVNRPRLLPALIALLMALPTGIAGAEAPDEEQAEYLREANALLTQGDAAEALVIFRQIEEQGAFLVQALIGAGRASARLRQPSAARRYFRRAAELAPAGSDDAAAARIGEARLLTQLGMDEQAARVLESIPDASLTPENRADVRTRLRDIARREAQTQATRQLTPATRLKEAGRLMRAGEPGKALSIYQQLIAERQFPVQTHIGAGRAYAALGGLDMALTEFRAAVAAAPAGSDDAEAARIGEIHALMRQGDIAMAKTILTELRSQTLAPENEAQVEADLRLIRLQQDQADLRQAFALLKADHADQALLLFERMVIEQPQPVRALIGAARAHAALDQPRDALDCFRRAAELAPPRSEDGDAARLGQARMLIWLGRYQEGEQLSQELLHHPMEQSTHDGAVAAGLEATTLRNRPITSWQRAAGAAPLDDEGHYQAAFAAYLARWPDKAQAELDHIPQDVPAGRLERGVRALRREVQDELRNPLNGGYAFSRDSDNFSADKFSFAAGKRLTPVSVAQVDMRYGRYGQRSRSLDFGVVQGEYARRINDTLWVSGRAGLGQYDGWTPVLWSGSAYYRDNDRWGVGFDATREVIETFRSFDRHVTDTSLALSGDYQLTDRLAVAGVTYAEVFSDDNTRYGFRVKPVYTLSEFYGLNVQLPVRHFENTNTDARNYFNPDDFTDAYLLFGLRHRFNERWRLQALAGPGIQQVSGNGSQRTTLAEVSLPGTLSGCLSVNPSLGYSDSANTSDTGFSTTYGSLYLSCPW